VLIVNRCTPFFPAHVIDRIQHEVLFKHITFDDLRTENDSNLSGIITYIYN
jgi:hypothetical protein